VTGRQRLEKLQRIERQLWALAHPDADAPCAYLTELDNAAHILFRLVSEIERPGYRGPTDGEARP
jgi:hypothetical protein